MQLVAKPCVDEAAIRQLGRAAKNQGDTLLGMLSDAQLIDIERSRRWTKALVEFVDQKDCNRALLKEWIEKWAPLGDRAIDAYCAALPGIEDAGGSGEGCGGAGSGRISGSGSPSRAIRQTVPDGVGTLAA